MSRIGRPKKEYDIAEVNEIIDRKLKNIGGDISKLSYHSVSKYNKELTERKIKNYKGDIFTDYGKFFWNGDYQDKANFGKERVDYYKQHKNINLLGENFDIDVTDIELIFENNRMDLKTIQKRIIKIFRKERKNNANNEKMFIQMQKDVQHYKSLINKYQEVIFMLFYNSQYSSNSLDNVITMKNSGDALLMNEIKKLFDAEIGIEDILSVHTEDKNEGKKVIDNFDSSIIQLNNILKNQRE